MIYQGKRFLFVKDHRGSILKVVDTITGETKQQLAYSEFGEVLMDTNPGFQPFGFAGGLYDHDTKLVRFGARDYDGRVGRWLSKDPIRFEGGDTNLYGYVLNDPVNLMDANGKFPILLTIPILTGAANAVGSFIGTLVATHDFNAAGSAALSGLASGTLTGAMALGTLYYGLPAGAASVLTGLVLNVATSLTDATDILGSDLPRGHSNFAKNTPSNGNCSPPPPPGGAGGFGGGGGSAGPQNSGSSFGDFFGI